MPVRKAYYVADTRRGTSGWVFVELDRGAPLVVSIEDAEDIAGAVAEVAANPAKFPQPTEPRYAEDRPETEPCQRGTAGCCVDHHGNENCEAW